MRISAVILGALAASVMARPDIVNSASQDITGLASVALRETATPSEPSRKGLPTGSAARSSILAFASAELASLTAEAATITGAAGTTLRSLASHLESALSSVEANTAVAGQKTTATQSTATPSTAAAGSQSMSSASAQSTSSAGSTTSTGNVAPATALPIALGGLGMAVIAFL